MSPFPSFIVAKANEFLIKTGMGVEDIYLCKKCWVYPFQRVTVFSVSPVNYTLSLQAMSAEKLEFTLPAVFTIGPRDQDQDALKKYARLLSGSFDKNNQSNELEELVRGVIEGETRVIAASLTMEEIFQQRKLFKEQVIKNVQSELDQFGLFIYNANVKQLQDTAGSEYFHFLRQKTEQGVVNQAKVDVAEAKYRGDVGEKERSGLTRREQARIEADTVIYENEKKADVAKAQGSLATKNIEIDNSVLLARIQADKRAQVVDADLQKELEIKLAAMTLEKQRSDVLAKTKVDAEGTITMADAALYKQQRQVDGELYERTKTAEGKLYQQSKEAEGILAIYEAQASGLNRLKQALGSERAVLDYLMLDKGLYLDLAKSNAEAIRGLQPKITVWNTGSSNGETDTMRPIRDVFQSIPPLLTTIQEQTGITAPAWMANMQGATAPAPAPVPTKQVNGIKG
ncbi:hypothetical protein SmJEL517_g00277 [Synchytrium microbalum]|uniref:Band 7 domain-containing protein n=1 Tax=Synchytrium microbalum TaxID=1806994 RepID=A0A507CEQ3_9FUNG|nr:uncharacterized protein SmJEL517_g00277 [Synchytrium microbalum]TPX37961.1 hypothetical protein SmJEL517_g00277 [Synchytrium microbalum]